MSICRVYPPSIHIDADVASLSATRISVMARELEEPDCYIAMGIAAALRAIQTRIDTAEELERLAFQHAEVLMDIKEMKEADEL